MTTRALLSVHELDQVTGGARRPLCVGEDYLKVIEGGKRGVKVGAAVGAVVGTVGGAIAGGNPGTAVGGGLLGAWAGASASVILGETLAARRLGCRQI